MQSKSTVLFSNKSDAYAKYRPGYPDNAIEIILTNYKYKKNLTVIDVGAGTGIASQQMASKGGSVIAVEPNQAMIEAAISYPNITFLQASAEAIPLPDESADIVTSFQAFHWFHFSNSLKEFSRLLKPSGRLALVWSYWDIDDPFTAKYVDLIDEATFKNKDRMEPYDGFMGKIKKIRIRALWKTRILPGYRNVKRYRLKFVQETDLHGLIGCARSQSFIKHTGPLWEELTSKIELLYSETDTAGLVYQINVFTAQPQK